ncbi:MAG TPA: MHYT domain-containing protein [Nevskia sp.]|nr:MHYT domain-containing protein [Nevskia sp.]
MNGTYDLNLVLASWCVAVAASYAAFDLGGRIACFESGPQKLWLPASAVAMGSGIWSAHFIGMQALGAPGLSFDLSLTLLSWLAAVAASLLAVYVISRSRLGAAGVAAGGVVMGLGICVMHYAGMFALRMTPRITYDSELFSASVFIAVGLSIAALLIGLSVRRLPDWQLVPAKLCGALLMGAAICGMHYTGMAAAHIPPGAACAAGNALSGNWMGLPVALFTIGIIAAVMLLSMFDAQRQEQRWQERQQRITARFRRGLARG